MGWRFSQTVVSRLLLLLIATLGRVTFAQDIFVTPVPNAPFSGVINVERALIQPDGSIVHLKTLRVIARDSRGRIHNESRTFLRLSDPEAPQVVRIHLYDPQTRISTLINLKERTFSTRTLQHPPSSVPPSVRYGSPTDTGIPENQFTKHEDLGVQELEGLPVRGVRETQSIPEENRASGGETVIADEYWYSEDLRINVIIKHSDPRTGSVTMTVTQIARTEPDPGLFEIPDGYTPAGAKAGTKQ
jgi:hypothetical protein